MEKIENRKIVSDINTLTILAQRKLPVKVGFAIAKNLNKIEGILRVYNKEREKIIDKYCSKDKNGDRIIREEDNTYLVAAKVKKAFNKESDELLDIVNDVEIHKFKLEELGDIDISILELQAIEYMIEE